MPSVMAGRLLLRPDDGDSVVVASHPDSAGLLPHRSIAPATIHGIGQSRMLLAHTSSRGLPPTLFLRCIQSPRCLSIRFYHRRFALPKRAPRPAGSARSGAEPALGMAGLSEAFFQTKFHFLKVIPGKRVYLFGGKRETFFISGRIVSCIARSSIRHYEGLTISIEGRSPTVAAIPAFPAS